MPTNMPLPEINIIEEIPQALILPQPSQTVAAPAVRLMRKPPAKPAMHSSMKRGKMFSHT
jgi:hypothetical protein